MKRRSLTALDKLKVAIRQALCPMCGQPLMDLANTDFDHAHALALGGEDAVENLRAVHRNCHATKTRGTGATTAGTDIGKISKLKRIEKDPPGGEAFRRKLLAVKSGEPEPAAKKRKFNWPKGRKIENRKRSKP